MNNALLFNILSEEITKVYYIFTFVKLMKGRQSLKIAISESETSFWKL